MKIENAHWIWAELSSSVWFIMLIFYVLKIICDCKWNYYVRYMYSNQQAP